MLLYLSLLGFFLAGILIAFGISKHQSSRYLAIFFMLVSLYKLNEYVILYSGSIFWNAVISSNFTFLHYLIGPFFFFYIRSVIHQKNQLSKIDYLHFAPALIFLIALIPYILTPYNHKVEIAQQIVRDPNFLMNFKPTILSKWFSVGIVYLSRPFSILAYTFYSIWIFVDYKIRLQRKITSDQNRLMQKWLIVLFAVVLFSFILHWLLVYYAFQNDFSIVYSEGSLLLEICSLSFTLLILSPFLFPHILYGIMPIDLGNTEISSSSKKAIKADVLKSQPQIDKEYFNQIGVLVGEYLSEQKSFVQPGYNLNQLAEEINFPIHHLSYYFREIRQQNFTDYKNELRVKYACELILDEKLNGMTLEAIGEKAGFSSRVTFLRAFKKVTNQTPGNFKRFSKQTILHKTENLTNK